MLVAVARARHRHIDSENQLGDTQRLRPFERVLHEAAILQHIELEPDIAARLLNDFLN